MKFEERAGREMLNEFISTVQQNTLYNSLVELYRLSFVDSYSVEIRAVSNMSAVKPKPK